jgi:type II secretory pathway pseudopilin PulG
MINYRPRPLNNKAFTILELMIATAILSTILLLVTAMMISIGTLYYKGVNQVRVQDNVRNISDEISQQLQLNGGSVLSSITSPTDDPSATPEAFCIGTIRYNYIIGQQLSSTATSPQQYMHVLYRDTVRQNTCPAMLPAQLNSKTPPLDQVGDPPGTELMTPNARLTSFSITPTTSPFTLSIGEAYGDSDLLCDSGLPAGDCNLTTKSTRVWDGSDPTGPVMCKSNEGGNQFCATSSLTSTVVQRISGS